MTRLSLLFLPLLLTACPATGDDSKTTDDTATDTDGGECGVTIDETIPSQGATDADYRAAIEFHLSDADSTATATSSIAGTTQLSDDSETVSFIPNEPLEPSTSYTVTLNYCGGSADLSFTTSSLGTALTDTSILVGKTYSLDLAGARIVEPDGIGSVLTSYLTQVILVGVTSVDSSSIEMLGAIGAEGSDPPTQDTCTETIDFPTADFSDQPFFTVGPQDTTLSVAGYDITIGELNITGTFAADGSYFAGGTLAGTIDTRPLAPLLDDSGDEGAICDLAVSFGAVCEACPSDGEPFCLSLVADQIDAEAVSGVTLTPLTADDVAADPSCAE